MSFLDKVKNMVNVSEDDYYDELESDDFRSDAGEEEPEEPRRPARRARERERDAGDNVVNIHTTARLQVVLAKPESFEEARAVADNLNEKRTVVLNLEKTEKEVSRRIVDFLSGVAYANNGKIKRVATNTFIITPYNVDLTGDDVLDELENNGLYF